MTQNFNVYITSPHDIDNLIWEVEKRPALYDQSLKEYSDYNVKKELWDEICSELISDWSELSESKRQNIVLEVQKKWKNLRGSFVREIKQLKDARTRQKAMKRKRYIYYDKLLFLEPYIEVRAFKSLANRKPRAANKSEEDTEDEDSLSLGPTDTSKKRNTEQHEYKSLKIVVPNARNEHSEPGKEHRTKSVDQQKKCELTKKTDQQKNLELRSIEQQLKNLELDEDAHFALSIVPMLRSLDEYSKVEAKIQILSLLRSIKFSGIGEIQYMTT